MDVLEYEDTARRHTLGRGLSNEILWCWPIFPIRRVIDGRPVASRMITHLVRAKLQIRYHVENAFSFVTKLGHYPPLLSTPWLRRHDASIRLAANKVTFDSEQCCKHYNAPGARPRSKDWSSSPNDRKTHAHRTGPSSAQQLCCTSTGRKSYRFSQFPSERWMQPLKSPAG